MGGRHPESQTLGVAAGSSGGGESLAQVVVLRQRDLDRVRQAVLSHLGTCFFERHLRAVVDDPHGVVELDEPSRCEFVARLKCDCCSLKERPWALVEGRVFVLDCLDELVLGHGDCATVLLDKTAKRCLDAFTQSDLRHSTVLNEQHTPVYPGWANS